MDGGSLACCMQCYISEGSDHGLHCGGASGGRPWIKQRHGGRINQRHGGRTKHILRCGMDDDVKIEM